MNHRKDYPNTGSGRTIVSLAQRRDERTIALTDKVGGKVVDTQEISVSAERNTLTMTMYRTKATRMYLFSKGSKPRTNTVDSELREGFAALAELCLWHR